MLGYSEPFSLVVLEQLDAPECPVQVEHAQKLENIDLHVDVVPFVEFGVERHFLEGKSAEVLEARVVLAEVVEGRLAQEVGDIVGEVVGAEVVVIDEVDTGVIYEDIRAREVVVAETQGLLRLGQEESSQVRPIAEDRLKLFYHSLMELYIASLCAACFVLLQLLSLPIRKQVVRYGFFLTGDAHLVEFIDLLDYSLHKGDVLELLLARVPGPCEELLDPEGLLCVDHLRGELEMGEMLHPVVLGLPVEAVCEDLEDVEGEAIDVNSVCNVGVPAESLQREGSAFDIGDIVGRQLLYFSLQHSYFICDSQMIRKAR